MARHDIRDKLGGRYKEDLYRYGINWSHPIAQELVFLLDFGMEGERTDGKKWAYDHGPLGLHFVPDNSTVFQWASSPVGRGVIKNDAWNREYSYDVASNGRLLGNNERYTFLMWAHHTSGATPLYWKYQHTSTIIAGALTKLTTNLRFEWADGTYFPYAEVTHPTETGWNQIGGLRTTTNGFVVLNGILTKGQDIVTQADTSGTADYFHQFAHGNPYTGADHAIIWHRPLLAHEIAELFDRPFCFCAPRKRYWVFGVPGAGPTIKTIDDVCDGADVLAALAVAVTVADVASGDDVLGGPDALVPVADIAEGTDTIADLLAGVAVADVADGTDAIDSIGALVPVADTADGTDAVPVISVGLTVADTADGADTLDIAALVTIADVADGTDSITVITAVLKTVADALTGTDEIGAVSVALTVADSADGTDAPAVAVALTISDVADGTDSVDVIKATLKTITDALTGTDEIGAVSVALTVADVATGTDAAPVIAALLAIADVCGGVDTVANYGITTKIVRVTFGLKKPGVAWGIKKPNVDFELN